MMHLVRIESIAHAAHASHSAHAIGEVLVHQLHIHCLIVVATHHLHRRSLIERETVAILSIVHHHLLLLLHELLIKLAGSEGFGGYGRDTLASIVNLGVVEGIFLL
jgi:hypothetical protein